MLTPLTLTRNLQKMLQCKRWCHKWIKPDGHDTGIKVFNCITRDKQSLIVKNKHLVTWYTCGPTVYDSSHLGHASCFLKLDIIQRILKHYFNLNLVTAMNITDVDDKIIARSNALKISPNQLTTQFEKEFWKDMDALDIRRPDCVLRVTENMEVIKKFIGYLMRDNKAYLAENNTIYFDVGAYDNYGKLQTVVEPSKQVQYKTSSMDFALWKAAKPGEIFWESPWGDGRPGWHIECTALASHIFGSEIDVHAGGIDLKFPHHENEEAQSCSIHNKTQWVNYWFHTGHLHLKNNEKMSKSLRNTISVADLLKDYSPQTFRMACLMSHYRKSMEFSPELMTTASDVLQNYTNLIDNCQNYLNGLIKSDINDNIIDELIRNSTIRIHEAFLDDFNTPLILKTLNDIVSTVNKILHSSRTDLSDSKSASIIGVSNLVLTTLDILGISTNKKESISSDGSVEIMNILNEFRKDVRQLGISKKDQELLQLCDNVRSKLKNLGIIIKDHGKLSSWS